VLVEVGASAVVMMKGITAAAMDVANTFPKHAGTLAISKEYGCEDSRKFVSGTSPKLVNWLTRLKTLPAVACSPVN